MTKFYEGVLYKGNIVKQNSGKIETIEEGVMLIYSNFNNCFYSYKVLNELLDIELNRHLSEEDRKEKEKKVSKYTYNLNANQDGIPYIDSNTIIPFIKPNETKKEIKKQK